MAKERIVKLTGTLADGNAVIEHADGRLEKMTDASDWQRVDALTEDEIHQAALADNDWDGLVEIDWSKIEITRPARKTAISIRVDEDVLSFFKAGGDGYQKRINAVLRSYVTASSAAAPAKKLPKQRSRG